MALQLAMSVFLPMIIVSLLPLAFSVSFSSTNGTLWMNYVAPTRSTVCPGPCLTLDEFANEPDNFFFNYTIFYFLPGSHQLNTSLRLVSIRHLSFRGLPTAGSVATIVLDSSANIIWEGCENIEITSLAFTLAGNFTHGLMFDHAIYIKVYNVTILGSEGTGCSSVVIKESMIDFANVSFVGISGQIGAALMASGSNVTFAGNNTFTHNVAVVGGAVYLATSKMTLTGSNYFMNNVAVFQSKAYFNDVLCNDSTSILERSVDQDNGSGGAIFCNNSTIAISGNSTFVNNTAERVGGAVAVLNGSSITIQASTLFDRNSVSDGDNITSTEGDFYCPSGGGAMYSSNSEVFLAKTTFSSCYSSCGGGALQFDQSIVTIHGIDMINNSAQFIAGAMRLINSSLMLNGTNWFRSNVVFHGDAGALELINCSKVWLDGEVHFINNSCQQGFSGAVALINSRSTIELRGTSSFKNNTASYGGALGIDSATVEFVGTSFLENNAAYNGGAVYMYQANVSFIGNSTFRNNRASGSPTFSPAGGALYANDSIVFILTAVTFGQNTATDSGGAIASYNSVWQLVGDVKFDENAADNGGAMALYGTTKLILSQNLDASFTGNKARTNGGAMFFMDSVSSSQCSTGSVPIDCFVSFSSTDPLEDDISFTFVNNSARVRGSVLYGGNLNKCRLYYGVSTDNSDCENKDGLNFSSNAFGFLQNISTVIPRDDSYISSPAEKICLCNKSSPNCTSMENTQDVMPGQQFELSLVAFGQFNNIVNSTVLTKNTDSDRGYRLSPSIQSTGLSCTTVFYRLYAADIVNNSKTTYKLYHDGPCQSLGSGLILDLNIIPCPVGFVLDGEQCVCDKWLSNFTDNCYIDNVSIERKRNNFWVAQQDNTNGLILHKFGCPFDFCKTSSVNVTLADPYVQCDFNRTGVMCGRCKQSYSLALGSLHCISCSDKFIALIVPFALAGIALVAVIFLLRLTVAVGTLNGLIFYANIIQANAQAFFPRETINFFTVFIAWLNLDLGIETCFYDGMNIYAYSWLQFLFPFYVWLLIGIIILVGRYSQTVAKSLGQNPVAVLATLLLMSYSKVLKAIIAPLSLTRLTYTFPSESRHVVWLYDGGIDFLTEPKHLVLGVFAALVYLFLYLPYTLLLLCGHWLQAYSHWRALSWLNKIKPFMDVYHAPYRKQTRYWTGLLLLARGGLFLTFATNSIGSDGVNLLAVSSVATALAIMKGRVYEKHYNDLLESSFILNLCIFSVATFYIKEEGSGSQYILSGVSVGLAFVTFIGIITFHLYLQLEDTYVWRKIVIPYASKCRLLQKFFRIVPVKNDTESPRRDAIGGYIYISTVELREPLLENNALQ